MSLIPVRALRSRLGSQQVQRCRIRSAAIKFAMASRNTESRETAQKSVIDERNLRSSGLPRMSWIVRPSTALTSAVHSRSLHPKT